MHALKIEAALSRVADFALSHTTAVALTGIHLALIISYIGEQKGPLTRSLLSSTSCHIEP
jgi:hypothetical protein